jgi:flagellum-specific ATP synthase
VAHSFDQMLHTIERTNPIEVQGKIADVVGLTVEATGPAVSIGDLCYIKSRDGRTTVPVEVVGFRGHRILLMPLGEMHGIGPDSLLTVTRKPQMVPVGPELLGRVVGSMGHPIDGRPIPECRDHVPLMVAPPRPLDRSRIVQALPTGVRAIDMCMTIGKGQRVGVLSGSGVGKSKLMGMIARSTSADINVIALIGERGREVRDFLEVDLGTEGLARSVVVAATSDEPALMRIKGAFLATAIAEWFRDQGKHVLLMMDSVTRFAMAQREVGLAIGEPPTTKGYPPSVYAALPRLLERAGTSLRGSITGLYTVLVEADDLNDPVGDHCRSILDGHIALSRGLASRGHYPAIDILESISRVMIDVVGERHLAHAMQIRRILATHRDAEDLVNIGAYTHGSNPEIDTALKLIPKVRKLLQQGLFEKAPFDEIEGLMRQALSG